MRGWDDDDWKFLLRRIETGRCTPFIGSGMAAHALPTGAQLAESLADRYNYPLKDRWDLARVCQYMAIKEDPATPKEEVEQRLRKTPPPDFEQPDEPHAVLADLPFPYYITTNYDDYMFRALEATKRRPKRDFCRWSESATLSGEPDVFEDAHYVPDADNPLVYHLHGHIEVVESMLVSEDDYLDFLVRIAEDPNLLPPRIKRAWGNVTLLFIGYRLADWNFRVLHRGLLRANQSAARKGLSVQLEPEDIVPGRDDDAIDYLENYYNAANVKVYWGSAQKFCSELRERWIKWTAP